MNQVPALTVVTGGAQGIGMAVAMLLVSAGRPVVLVDMNAEALAQAQTALAALGGGQVTTRVLDVRDAAATPACARDIEATIGPVEALVTCAGTTRSSAAATMPLDDWNLVLDINLTGTFLSCQAFAAAMLHRGRGAIVTITSVSGTGGQAGRANYVASK